MNPALPLAWPFPYVNSVQPFTSSVDSSVGSVDIPSMSSAEKNSSHHRPRRRSTRLHPRSSSAGNLHKQWKCPLSTYQLKDIDHDIMIHYKHNVQCQELFRKKMRLRDALYSVMKDIIPFCGLYVVGSSLNGFGNDSSDMDLCLMLSHSHEIDQRTEASEILMVLKQCLRFCDFVRDIYVIKAKVPILRFVDTLSGIECDLNVNNSCGIYNTHLLHAYSQLDERVRPLVLYVKYWAKLHAINDAKNCTLSSYSLALMAIHYLQYGVNPPVLPCLQRLFPHVFNDKLDIRSLSLVAQTPPTLHSQNTKSVGELFTGFLYYYAFEFNYERDAISIRLGQCLPREVVTRQNAIANPPSQWKELCIEEPFNLSNTARSVFDPRIFQQILTVFRSSYSQLIDEGQLSAITNETS